MIFDENHSATAGSMFAVLMATAAVGVFELDKAGIKVIGTVPGGLPEFGLSHITLRGGDLGNLAAVAVGIAIDRVRRHRTDRRHLLRRDGSKIDANAELRALGIYNMGTALAPGGSRSVRARAAPHSVSWSAPAPRCTHSWRWAACWSSC